MINAIDDYLVDYTMLVLGAKIAHVVSGTVYDVSNLQIAGVSNPVYKEYSPGILDRVDTTILEEMPQLLEHLTFKDRLFLMNHIAWPVAVVRKNGSTSGFIMEKIPDQFFTSLVHPHRERRTVTKIQEILTPHLIHPSVEPCTVNKVQDLLTPTKDMVVDTKARYAILQKISEIIAFLHERGITIGDLQPNDIAYSLAGDEVEVFITGCDTMSIFDNSAVRKAEVSDWEAPERSTEYTSFLSSSYADVYKFSLLVLRLLTRDALATDPEQLHGVDPQLAQRITQGLSINPCLRGDMKDYQQLLSTAARKTSKKSVVHIKKVFGDVNHINSSVNDTAMRNSLIDHNQHAEEDRAFDKRHLSERSTITIDSRRESSTIVALIFLAIQMLVGVSNCLSLGNLASSDFVFKHIKHSAYFVLLTVLFSPGSIVWLLGIALIFFLTKYWIKPSSASIIGIVGTIIMMMMYFYVSGAEAQRLYFQLLHDR